MKELKNYSIVLITLAIVLLSCSAFAEEEMEDDIFDMSLEELGDLQIGVASRKTTTAQEAPGVLTIITREQIQKSGARDMIDILRMVPGFDVNYDVYGAFGVSIRGMWANEGKVLVLMDGVPLNEEGYGTFQYGHHIPVDVIERIEIMRGPGSAMYGDSAELGVISIITRQPEGENEFFVSSTYARTENAMQRQEITGYFGTKNEEEDFSLSVIYKYARGNTSDRQADAIDAWWSYGYELELGEDNNSLIVSPFWNVAAQWGNLSARAIIDRYEMTSGWPGVEPYASYVYSDIYQLQYDMPVTDKLTITSKYLYKSNMPWNYQDRGGGDELRSVNDKFTYDVYASYDFENGNNLVLGTTYDEIRGGDQNASDYYDYHSSAFYYELLWKNFCGIGDLTAGGRYVDHSYSGSKHVPRIALTNTIDNWYYKLLYSQAYRSPSILNIRNNKFDHLLKAETATTFEAEIGAQLNDEMSFSVNAFDVEVAEPIIWDLYGSYFNEDEMGSRGIEFSGNYKKDIYDIGVTYSWYEENDNKVANTTIPDNDDMMLANASHKVSLYASINPCEDFYITPTMTYYSPRYSIVKGTDGPDWVHGKIDASILTNLSFLKKNAFDIEGMDLSFSIYNMFNEDYKFIQHTNAEVGNSYAGGPMPGPSRSFIFTLSYDF